MARSGLYKSEVKTARDSLLAQGRHPSVDAVRIELGNTGSKSTIHKYLKELEDESGTAIAGDRRRLSVSDSLQSLVVSLAEQLQSEAEERIIALQAVHAKEQQQAVSRIAALEKELEALRAANEKLEAARLEDRYAFEVQGDKLRQETLARHTSQQQVSDLKERLLENEVYRRSLEEKHQHAREALEHYRNSVKEQRDQDIRRHEQQVQQLQAEMRELRQSLVVRQEDATRLNQEAARLAGELSHAQQASQEKEGRIRSLESRIEPLLAESTLLKTAHGRAEELSLLLQSAVQRNEDLALTLRQKELELAGAHARLEAQQSVMEEWRLATKAKTEPTLKTPAAPE